MSTNTIFNSLIDIRLGSNSWQDIVLIQNNSNVMRLSHNNIIIYNNVLNEILSNTGDVSSITTVRDMNNNNASLLSTYVNLTGSTISVSDLLTFSGVDISESNQVVYKSYADNVLTTINFKGSIYVNHDVSIPLAIATSNFVLTSIPSMIINSGYVILNQINLMTGNIILSDMPMYQQLQASTLKYLNDSINILENSYVSLNGSSVDNLFVSNININSISLQIANKQYLTNSLLTINSSLLNISKHINYLSFTGGVLTGSVQVESPIDPNQLANQVYVLNSIVGINPIIDYADVIILLQNYVPVSGSKLKGDLVLPLTTNNATKGYVDTLINNVTNSYVSLSGSTLRLR